ncbi:unnamed protein product [Allacma fusca]|uniref:Ion transport domain-containing protein n=1 Tax=Allacma fusca TaxID=39272 RepID=A0A8J2PWZ3_9HEXA|nr:unnamed protein product [Allacma fusca]
MYKYMTLPGVGVKCLHSKTTATTQIENQSQVPGDREMADNVVPGLVRKSSQTSSHHKFAKPPSYYLLHDSTHPKRLFPPHLYNRPLEEVDPFVFEDTFCMIGRKLGQNYVYRFSATKSLHIFGPLSSVRKFACRIIYSLSFDIFIILVILTNCVTLATYSNWEIGVSGTFQKNKDMEFVIKIMEYIFVGVYTVEMSLKVIAKGFVCNKFSYLRNVWNSVDFLIIVFGYITIILGGDSVLDKDLQFFSTLRVLRTIKTVSLIPGLRLMTNALLKSVVQLVEVMTLTMFCLMIFALLALQLYMGKLLQKCVLMKNSEAHRKMVYEELSRDPTELNGGPIRPGDPEARKMWNNWVHKKENWLMRTYPFNEPVPCSNETVFGTGRVCPNGYVCLENIGENFDRGWTSFDNFFSAMLTTFQMITTDFWERPYDLIMSTTNPFSVIFCIIVIFLGFFYLLNLMLAVVAMSYEREFKKKSEIPLTKQQKLSVHRKASTFSFHDPARLKVTVMTSYRKRTPSEREILAKTLKESKEEFEYNSTDVEPTEIKEKKRPNLHDAIMSLLGRRFSMDGKVIKKLTRTDGSIKSDISGQSLPSNLAFPHTDMIPTLQHDISPIVTPPTIPVKHERSNSINSIHSVEESFASTITKSAKLLAATLHLNANNCFTRKLLLIRTMLTPIVTDSKFEVLITVLILMNTLLFASEHHGQPQWLDELVVETHGMGNIFFTTVFALEAVMKIFALQNEYFTSWWNLFDFAIVIQSILDIALHQYQLFSAVFKPMRLLRIFKLAHTWITMKVLLNIIFSTFGALGNLTLVLLIVLYMFAILGLKVVGEHYVKKAFNVDGDEDDFPRWNWQSFVYAFMLVFRVICGEWIEPFLECLTATAKSNTEHKCFFIYLPVFVIGNLIILNLFLALLLNSFDTEELNARHKQIELEAAGKADKLKKYVGVFLNQAPNNRDDESRRSSLTGPNDIIDNAGKSTVRQPRDKFKVKAKQVILLNRKKVAEKMLHETEFRRKQEYSARRFSETNALLARHSVSFGVSQAQFEMPDVLMSRRELESCIPQKCWTVNCCFFRSLRKVKWRCWNSTRNCALAIVTHPVFEWLILALIFASSVTLCFEDVYLERRQDLKNALFYINITFSGIFVLEMVIKWFALGIWNYFTSWWTLLDFFIICVSVSSWYFDYHESIHGSHSLGSGFGSLKALRTLRALRPLRAISRWQGMKIVVNALMYAIPSIINVLLVCILFWLIFSIMGVQFFKGRFYKCVENDTGNTVPVELVGTREECCKYTNKWSWINQQPNFDNVFQGYLTLFQVATFEGWMEAMQASVDAVGINKQPKRDNNLLAYLYYVIFIVIGAFFILNLFIGVIIDNFNRLKKKYEGNLVEVLLTPSQLHYYTAMKKLGRKKPRKVIKRPNSFFVGVFYDMSMSRRFEIIVFVLIFLNIFIMAFESYNQRRVHTNILDGFNALFTTIFALEAMAKIIGLRHYYFTIPWNIFDFTLVFLSIIDIGLGETGRDLIPVPPTFLRVVRVFRVGRVLRLIKAAAGIRKLLFALIVSLPALFNIGCLLFLITFIYAVLGMTLFGGNAHNLAIDSVFNFDTFLRSCLMLLRLMTAAGWNDVLMAMTVERPYCGTYRNIKCGRLGEGKSIILENFYEANREEDVGIVEDDLEMFYIRWARYDPQATQFIAFEYLSEFLASLDKPLGVPIPNIVAIVAFNLPIARGNKIHCLDVLHALVKHVLGYIDDTEEFRKVSSVA